MSVERITFALKVKQVCAHEQTNLISDGYLTSVCQFQSLGLDSESHPRLRLTPKSKKQGGIRAFHSIVVRLRHVSCNNRRLSSMLMEHGLVALKIM